MKQQFTGTYSLDVVNRYITLHDIQLKPEQVLLVVNATVGFVYHNFSVDETANISIVAGNTKIEFPPYKDCDTHTISDALAVFYDDGVDLGQLILTESNETQTLLQTEFDLTQSDLAAFRTEVKAESDETQNVITAFRTEVKAESDETQNVIVAFRTEVKAESDETQSLLLAEFNQTQSDLAAFRVEVKDESDATQTLLQTEFNQTQEAITGFRLEAKNESDETQDLLQFEFDQTQDAISHFRSEVKSEMEQTQSVLETEFHNTQAGVEAFKTEVKNEFDSTQTLLTDFKAEAKAESDVTQALLTDFKTEVKNEFDDTQLQLSQLIEREFNETQIDLSGIRTEIKNEFDETQTLLTSFKTEVKNEFDSTQTLLTDFKAEAKAESDVTQALLQNELDLVKERILVTQVILSEEFGQTQTLLTDFKNEVKAESDETQTFLSGFKSDLQTKLDTESGELQTKIGTESSAVQGTLLEYKDAIVLKMGTESVAIREKLNVESGEIQTVIQTESGNVQGKLLEYKDDIAGTIEAQSTAVQTKLNVESGEIQAAIQTESGNVQVKLLEYKDDIVGTIEAESTALQTKMNDESAEIKQTLETQSLAIQTKLDQILVDDFKNAIVNAVTTEGDEIQTKLGVESDEIRADLTAWRTEVKAGIDAGLDATGPKDAPTTNSVEGNWSVVSLLKGIFYQIFGKLPSLTTTGRIPVDIGGDGSITVTAGTITVQNEVEISNDEGNPVPVSIAAPFVNTSDSTIRTSDLTLTGRVGSSNTPVATDDFGDWSLIALVKRSLTHLATLMTRASTLNELQAPISVLPPNVRRINASSFVAAAGVVQFGPAISGSPQIFAEQVVAVVNITRNAVYFSQGNSKSAITVTNQLVSGAGYYLNILGFVQAPPSSSHSDSDTVVVYYSTAPQGAEATEATLAAIEEKIPALDNNKIPVTLGATVVSGDSHSLIPGTINRLAIDLPTGKDAASNIHPSVTVQPVIGSRNFPISGTVTGPLTNTELRAAAVPVSGPMTASQFTDRFGDFLTTAATTDTESTSFLSLFKRLLSVKLPAGLGQRAAGASFPVVLPSDSTMNVNLRDGAGNNLTSVEAGNAISDTARALIVRNKPSGEHIIVPRTAGIVQLPGLVGTSSIEVRVSEPQRKYLLIQNLSSAPIHVGFGSSADTNMTRIESLGSLCFEGSFVPSSRIELIGTQADQKYCILAS